MSGRSWVVDKKLEYDKHKWTFNHIETQEWGVTVTFYCANQGCNARFSMPCNPERDSALTGGICFNTAKAVQLTDRDGNPI